MTDIYDKLDRIADGLQTKASTTDFPVSRVAMAAITLPPQMRIKEA